MLGKFDGYFFNPDTGKWEPKTNEQAARDFDARQARLKAEAEAKKEQEAVGK